MVAGYLTLGSFIGQQLVHRSSRESVTTCLQVHCQASVHHRNAVSIPMAAASCVSGRSASDLSVCRDRASCRGAYVRTCAASVTSNKSTESAAPKKAEAVASTKYNFFSSSGHQVQSIVKKHQGHYTAQIAVAATPDFENQDVYVSWGAYRASAAKWFHPESITAADSEADPHFSKAKRVKLNKGSASGGAGSYSMQFKVPLQLAPVMLGFRLFIAGETKGAGRYLAPAGSRHFTIPVGLQAGHPLPQGPAAAYVSEDGLMCDINFAVRSRYAASVSLCLARQSKDAQSKVGYIEIALDPLVNKTGDMWHVCLEGLKDVGSLCYGWRAEADVAWEGRSRFHPGQVMMDPYCPVVTHTRLPDNANLVAPKGGAAGSMPINTPQVPLSSLSFLLDDFSFQGVQSPRHSLHDTVMCELDVASFTSGRQAEAAGVPVDHRGRYLGLLDRLDHIRQVGATAVLLTPVVMTAEGDGPMGQAPMSFFAPNPALAVGQSPLAASQELKHVIKQLHAHGIEVILQVEYCFTSEGTDKRPQASSLRGLDAATYYRHNGVLNCGHAVVRQLILDSLHHWADEYQIDGFCFVNAETLVQATDAREAQMLLAKLLDNPPLADDILHAAVCIEVMVNGCDIADAEGNILDNPPLADDIAQDPLLQGLKLMAWVADDTLLPRLGARGFPHWGIWAERNKAFTKDVVSLMVHNQPRLASQVATRITGSADLMAGRAAEGLLPGSLATGRPPAWGLNSVSAVSSLTLPDLVSQAQWNPGEEGQQATLAKSLLASSLLSQGTPIISQDALADPSLAAFVSSVVQFRRNHSALLQPRHFSSCRELLWHGATIGSQPDWEGEAAASGYHAANYIAYSLHRPEQASTYVGYNPYNYPMQIEIPSPPSGHVWRQAIDTAESAPLDAMNGPHEFPTLHEQNNYHIQAKAVIALLSEKVMN